MVGYATECSVNSLGRFPANSYLSIKMTPSKSSRKSSSELIVLVPNWSKFQRKFRWRRWGSSLPGLCTLDPPLSPPSKPAEIFRCTCLFGGSKIEKLSDAARKMIRKTFKKITTPPQACLP